METRPLGKSGLKFSVLGLGTWAIGGDWFMGWGPQDEKDSRETILQALEEGINWIDTAAAYGFGRAEEVVGRALKEWREPVIIATKCGVLPKDDGTAYFHIKRESILKEVEASLKRLGVETIDLYQIHWPRADEDIEEAFETLLELKRQGKIRHAGVSNFSVEQLERIAVLGEPASLQPPYSLLSRGIEGEILPWCEVHGVGVICYSPMECGLLTVKLSKEWVESLPESDWRKARWGRLKQINYFAEPELSALMLWVDKLRAIAERRGATVSELAINWVLRRREVTAAIVGARRKEQISETVRAACWKLSAEEIDEIERSYGAYQASMGR